MTTLKKISLLFFILIIGENKAQIAFAASRLSTNVANGTETIEIRLVVNTDSLVLPDNLTYNDITSFQVEKQRED